MKKHEDPKRMMAREKWSKAGEWLRILNKGIGARLAECWNAEETTALIVEINTVLAEAVYDYDRTDKAYEAYRRRVRINPKKKAAA